LTVGLTAVSAGFLKKENAGSFFFARSLGSRLDGAGLGVGLATGLTATLSSGTTAALGLGLMPPKRKPRTELRLDGRLTGGILFLLRRGRGWLGGGALTCQRGRTRAPYSVRSLGREQGLFRNELGHGLDDGVKGDPGLGLDGVLGLAPANEEVAGR
jgi:hypothetical protein